MSLDESDSILTALEILCHVRWEALQPHRDKAFLAFQKLQVFIGNRNSGESTPSPSPPNHSHTPPPSLRSHDPPPSPNNSNSPSPSSHNHDPPSSPNNSNSPSPSSHNHDPPSSPNNSNSLSRSSSNYDPPSSSDRSDSSLFSFSNHDTVTSSNHSRPFQNNDDRLASIDNLDLLSNSSPLLPDNYEPHSNEHNSPSHHKHTLALIQALNNEEDKIKKYLSKLEIDATEGKSSWPQEDSRLVDLQIGEKQSSSNIKFRKVLSQRSLAKEYDQWELETHHTSRINYLVENLSDSKDGAGGRIKKYVNGNIDRFKNKALAQRGIQWGIRLLVFERLLGEPGLSAILCFSFYRFRCLKFTDLVCLGQRVHETDWIWNLAKKKSGWLDSCQVYYDSKVTSRTSGIPVAQNNVPSKRYSSALEPSGKRPRVGQYNVSSHSTTNSNGDALTSTASLTSPVSNEEHAHGTAQANATILETTNSHQDAEYSQTQTHEGVVANPIHTLLLQKLTSSGVKDPHADYEEPMSDADADGGEDEEVDEDFGSSTTSNATSSCTSLSTLPQGFYRGQKHLYQAENVMTTAEPRRPHHLTPAFNNEQSNSMSDVSPMDILSQAVNVASHEIGQQNCNSISTVPPFQNTPSAPFPGNAVGSEQLREFATESNQMTKNTAHDPFTLATFPGAAQINPTGHELWNSYIAPDGTLTNPTQHNLWNSYIAANGTLVCSTEHNLWSSYICPDGTLACPTEHNLWNSYIAPEETLLTPLEYTVAPSSG